MTTRRAKGASARSGRTVLAGIVGIGMLLAAAACTSSSTDAASSSSAVTSTTESGPGEATQMTDASSSYDGAAPTVPSDGAPASGAGPSADATPTTPSAPPVSTSGPVPTSGDINQVVPEREIPTNPAVPLDGTADFGDKILARLTDVKAVDATARVPGEISGAALAVTVEIANTSSDPIGLDSVTVNLTGAGDVPAPPVTTDPASPLSGTLMPGEKKSGVYVFTIPADSRSSVGVTVLYSAGAPIVLFQGNAGG
jgi:hypothetical protein